MITIHRIEHPNRAATVDHRSGRTTSGRPIDSYRRVERPRPLPNYRLRRTGAVAGAALALLLSVQVAGAAITFVGASPAIAAGPAGDGFTSTSAVTSASHVARDGDSMWSIAESYRGDMDRNEYIERLIELNGGTAIRVGQAVLLP